MDDGESASDLFENAIDWLRESYPHYRFFHERDIVWVLQTHLTRMIESRKLPYRVFNGYRIPGPIRRHVDLVILGAEKTVDRADQAVELAAEFKYEPSHRRGEGDNPDISKAKLRPSVVSWKPGVGQDVDKARDLVNRGEAKVACAVLVDAGSHFRERTLFSESAWEDWGVIEGFGQVSLLKARFPKLTK